MEQQVQCPVCTLFLHSGISLESHLDTHPKDQVIKALCSLSNVRSSYSNGSTTPMPSERSYRSRSRTPVADDIRWSTPHTDIDRDRYWSRTPSRSTRTPKSRNDIPSDLRIVDINFENSSEESGPVLSMNNYSSKSENYLPSLDGSEPDRHYSYINDQPDDIEMKYSRSTEYSSYNNTANNVFTYNMQVPPPGIRLQTALLPTVNKRHNQFANISTSHKRGSEFLKIVPKSGNIALLKTSVGSLQYVTPNVKPMHVMLPNRKTFVQPQPNGHNNNVLPGNVNTDNQTSQAKSANSPILPNQFSSISTASFNPNTTVVTQNSQIIYREMVHNIEGKPFISTLPTVLDSDQSVTNVSQQSSLYQNVMMMDPYEPTSCMYPPQMLLPHVTSGTAFNSSLSVTTSQNKSSTNKITQAHNKNFVPEVEFTVNKGTSPVVNVSPIKDIEKNCEQASEVTLPKKGLKILSNIKVEVPVQHHKSLLNTIVDLTETLEPKYSGPHNDANDSFINTNQSPTDEYDVIAQPTTAKEGTAHVSNTFSVIKNIGNPTNKEQKSNNNDKINEVESSDSCPLPDLICNEKPSISPCSDLSESRENSIDHTSVSLKCNENEHKKNDVLQLTRCRKTSQNSIKSNPLKLNSVYVKKHKKVLQMKNVKTHSLVSTSRKNDDIAVPSTSSAKWPESVSQKKLQQSTEVQYDKRGSKQFLYFDVPVKKSDEPLPRSDLDADTEEQSMDIEPIAPSSMCYKDQVQSRTDVVCVKEEINGSNENFTTDQDMERRSNQRECMRSVNVISFGNMGPGNDGDKQLLELDTATKSKQFVSMMNDNYFGDNFYADYFTPDRVETFDTIKDLNYTKDLQKTADRCDGVYLWGEPSQKDGYIIPNFIHDNYKVTDSTICSNYTLNTDGVLVEIEVESETCERDSKVDVLSASGRDSDIALDISADERMPPRGELSGQESNGDMDTTPWPGEVVSSAPYDLIAREAWVSDGSEVDPVEKQDSLDEEVPAKVQCHECSWCGARFASVRELRVHRVAAHPPAPPPPPPPPASAPAPAPAPMPAPDPTAPPAPATAAVPTPASTPYSLLISTSIKKEKDEPSISTELKTSLSTTPLGGYGEGAEAKPKLELALLKSETRRRRRDYICPTCKVDQRNEVQFQAHLKIHPLECLTCGKYFYRRANLALHIKIHLGIKNYKCEVCEKRFLTKNKLAEHQNVHTGRAPVKCTLCDHTFRRHSNMIQHRNRHHLQIKKKVRDWVCNVCGEVFHSVRKLSWHRETHDERPRACLYCSEKFVHAASLTRHVRRAHNAYYLPDERRRAENVPCPICKQIYLKTNLEVHMKTHSGQKPFQCVVCSKSFTTKWNLKLHSWTHASRSAKPYKCVLCKCAYVRHSEFVSHMNAHRALRPYTCNHCGCQFIRRYNYLRHVREHDAAKRYVCRVPDCGKTFHRSYYLTDHMRVHSGARPFACPVCGKTSSNKSNHNKHLKIHHTREPVATEA